MVRVGVCVRFCPDQQLDMPRLLDDSRQQASCVCEWEPVTIENERRSLPACWLTPGVFPADQTRVCSLRGPSVCEGPREKRLQGRTAFPHNAGSRQEAGLTVDGNEV